MARAADKSMTDAAGLAARIEAWFVDAARPLPWRTIPRDAYRSLVSEAMLQQTQVSRVVEKFESFVARFPTVEALAGADENDVLAAWAGLGYYRRARMLQAAAREIVDRHGGGVPEEAAPLRALPGVGRYTAGAISSIVFGRREALVDGNVGRVLLRVHGRVDGVQRAEAWLWARAGEYVRAASNAPLANEGLMELGAVICLPKSPRCDACPLRGVCVAQREGSVDRIPAPKPPPTRRVLYCDSVRTEDERGRVILERRGERGLWRGMWQAPTSERTDRHCTKDELETALGLPVEGMIGAFTHLTSHREVRFVVWKGACSAAAPGVPAPPREWVTLGDALARGISNAQRRVLAMTPQAVIPGLLA